MNKYSKFILLKITYICIIIHFCKNSYPNTPKHKKVNDHLLQLEHTSNAHGQCLRQLQKQFLEIEQEVDHLRGQIQEVEYQVLKITEQQKNIIKTTNSFEDKKYNVENNIDTNINNSLENKHNTLTTHNHDYHIIAYNQAVNLVLKKKQYKQAIQAFEDFILQYPNSIYQANAHYWLGQLNYRKGNKNNASYHFALVAKNYPKSSKASDALLKIGMIMEETGYKNEAKSIYKKVNYLYPNTDASKQSTKRLNNY